MAAPWEQYQQQRAAPWRAYAPAPDPTARRALPKWTPDAAFEQGALLGPIEQLGQRAEQLPGVAGRVARSVGGTISRDMPAGMRQYLAESKQAAAADPTDRTIGEIFPWLVVGPERALWRTGAGAVGGFLTPVNRNDPHYWRDVALNTAGGAASAWALDRVAQSTAARDALERAARGARRLMETSPVRATLNLYRRIYHELGIPDSAPTAITRETNAQVQQDVGKRLNSIYGQMRFTPDAAWTKDALRERDIITNSLVNPEMRARWERTFGRSAIAPAFSSPAPMSGEKLQQLVSDLSAEQNEFGLQAQAGGPHADQWRLMAQGLRRIRESIEARMDASNPALAPERRAANRAYHLWDVSKRATSATEGGVATPRQIIGAWEKKVGKTQYGGSPRFSRTKQMLDIERRTHAGEHLPPEGRPSAIGRDAAHLAGHAAARAAGLPWYAGSVIGRLLRGAGRGVQRAGAIAGTRPGATGAAAANVVNLLSGANAPVQPPTTPSITPGL